MTPAPSCHFNTMLTTYCYSLQARGIVNNGQRVHGARFVPVAPPLIRVTMSSHVHAGTCVVLVNVCGSYTQYRPQQRRQQTSSTSSTSSKS